MTRDVSIATRPLARHSHKVAQKEFDGGGFGIHKHCRLDPSGLRYVRQTGDDECTQARAAVHLVEVIRALRDDKDRRLLCSSGWPVIASFPRRNTSELLVAVPRPPFLGSLDGRGAQRLRQQGW